jgi:hypothetical protein
MQWYKPLYIGERACKQKRRMIHAIKYKKWTPTAYVITLSRNGKDLLDIYPSYVLLQKQFPREDLYVVGLAADKEEAFQVVIQIVDDVYQTTGALEIRSWFVHDR